MSRLFSIIVTLFILFLVYLWVGHISGQDQSEPETVPTAKVADVSRDRVYNISDTKEEDPETGSTEALNEDNSSEEVTLPVEEEVSKPQASSNVPAKKAVPETTSKTSPPRHGGNLVVVGNFLERANAEKHLATVKALGYPDAEILQFEISQYYTVCAARYSDPTEARRAARRIKDQHGIDAYMRAGN